MEQITEIEVNELRKEDIEDKDKEQVELLGKTIRIRNKLILFLLLPMRFMFKLIFIIDILYIIGVAESGIGLESPLIYFAGLIILYVEYVLKIENKRIKQGPTRLQYGIVSDKYTEARKGENGTIYDYYVDVLFTEDNTKVNKSEVSRSIYTTLEKGEKVLVVSFNDEKSYSIKAS